MKNLQFYLMIFILFFCFAINVSAKDDFDMTYRVPKDSTMTTLGTYSTNSVDLTKYPFTPQINYFTYDVKHNNETLTSSHVLAGTGFQSNKQFTIPSDLNYTLSIGGFGVAMNSDSLTSISPGVNYKLFLEIVNDEDLSPITQSMWDNFDHKNDNVNITFGDSSDMSDKMSELSVKFYRVRKSDGNHEYRPKSYLIVSFTVDSTLVPENWIGRLNTLLIRFFDNTDTQLNYLLPVYQLSKKNISPSLTVNSMVLLENGQYTLGFPICDSDGKHCHFEGAYGGGYDNITDADLALFDQYEDCDTTDIICHTRNLFSLVKNFFTRVGNFFTSVGEFFAEFFTNLADAFVDLFKKLFIPSEDFFTSHFNALNKGLHDRLGILTYPLDLLFNVFDRFSNLSNSSNGIINIPNINVPGFGNLIKARTFKINEYWSEEPFSTLYNIYLAFVHCFIGFCLYKLATKKEEEIIGGVYGR